ncbi:hypothetical protein BKA80DRAFT_273846 [Phyllosticta citrichinensis]
MKPQALTQYYEDLLFWTRCLFAERGESPNPFVSDNSTTHARSFQHGHPARPRSTPGQNQARKPSAPGLFSPESASLRLTAHHDCAV